VPPLADADADADADGTDIEPEFCVRGYGSGETMAVSGDPARRCVLRFRRQQKSKKPTNERAARPAIMPPAMAPAFVFLVWGLEEPPEPVVAEGEAPGDELEGDAERALGKKKPG
jgi:hypothetical protein